MAVDVALSWTLSPTTTDEVDGQRIYRTSTSSPTFPTDYTQIASVSDSTTTYTDTGVTEDKTFTYAVTAFNSAGESSETTTSIETVAAPSTPQNLAFTDTAAEDELSFAWDAVSWNGDEDSYQIYRAEAGGSTRTDYSQIATVPAGTASYTDTNLEDGERYFYRVGATNSAGDSDLSNEIDAVTVLPAATNVSASASAPDSVDVAWTNSDDSADGGIDVERSTDGFSTITTVASALSPSTTSYTDTSVSEGKTYEYRVERNTDHATTTSATAQATTPIARFVAADGTGDGAVSRSKTASRETAADGAGRASVSRLADATRSALASSSRGDAAVSRTATATRPVIATGGGDGVASRTASADRQTTGDGTGDATVIRTATPTRTLTATGDRGDAAVSRTASVSRSSLAEGNGDAVVSWLAPHAWALPQTPGASTDILLTPSGVETDYESIGLTATISEAKRESLAHYRRAGDVETQQTAFGAFRRIRRDGDDLLAVRPPANDSPPFASRRVAPVDMSADQVAPRRHEVSLSLGLEEPRAREPVESTSDAITVDTEVLDVAGGETETVTLSWTPDGSQLGNWTATVSSETDSDAQLVTVSNAPWTFAWPVATLSLTESRVGQVTRGSEAGVPSVTLPLRLNASQVATILAVGSRIEAVETRQVPDAGNVVVDTLPGDELTCSLDPPANSDIDAGTYVLRDWSVTQARPSRPRFDATVTLVRSE